MEPNFDAAPFNGATRPARIALSAGHAKPKTGALALSAAWERYRDARLIRQGRDEGAVRSHRDPMEPLLQDWLDRPVRGAAKGADPLAVSLLVSLGAAHLGYVEAGGELGRPAPGAKARTKAGAGIRLRYRPFKAP